MNIRRVQTPGGYAKTKQIKQKSKRTLISYSSENYSQKSPESIVVHRNSNPEERSTVKNYEKQLIEFGMSADDEDHHNIINEDKKYKKNCYVKNIEKFFIEIKNLEEFSFFLTKSRIYVFFIILKNNENLEGDLCCDNLEEKFDEILSDNCDFCYIKLKQEEIEEDNKTKDYINGNSNPLIVWNDPPIFRFYVRKKLVSEKKLTKNWIVSFSKILEENLKKERKKSEIERKRSGSENLLDIDFLNKNPWLQDHFCDQELMILFKTKNQNQKKNLDSFLCNFALVEDKIKLVENLTSILQKLSRSESPANEKKIMSSADTNSNSNKGSVFTFRKESIIEPFSAGLKKIESFQFDNKKISDFQSFGKNEENVYGSHKDVKKTKKSGFARSRKNNESSKEEGINEYKFPQIVDEKKSLKEDENKASDGEEEQSENLELLVKGLLLLFKNIEDLQIEITHNLSHLWGEYISEVIHFLIKIG